jgi:hypothetical protein
MQMNYIPEAQVWGDGRIIWTHFDGSNQRQVLAGQLAPEQIAEFLQNAIDSGFFGWEELYTSPLAPTDLPTRCIFIDLAEQSRKVCEYFEGAPEAFHQIYDELDQGLGLDGEDFIPSHGYLTAFLIQGPEPGEVPAWNAEAAGLAVEETAKGAWIEGPALEAAWTLINQHPSGPTVQEGESFYRLALQVPQLSMVAPPKP